VACWEELRAGERWIAPAPPTPPLFSAHPDRRVEVEDRAGHLRAWLADHLLNGILTGRAAEVYDGRAAIEAEIKADKGGLQPHRRRKRRLAAQEALALLTDVAHNVLAWTRSWMFRDSPFADAGIYRIVKELFPIPGKVTVKAGQLVKLRLKESHPLARPMLACLTRALERF
jgi:hypothetical protein